jgi:predicted metalloprotease
MRWTPGSRGSIDDLRGRSPVMRAGLPIGLGGVVILLIGSWLTGTNLFSLVGGGGGGDVGSAPPSESRPVATTPEEEKLADFVGAVADDLHSTWGELLGSRYQRTRVVLFREGIDSACGMAQSATGPFYCPSDRRVYLDLSFYTDLDRRLGAPGDFAQAYVLAHEVGHHIQTLLGTEASLRSAQQRAPDQARALSVALELQADCYAGVWGHAARQPGRFLAGRVELEPGDVEEGLQAASAVGDDRLQRMQTGRVVPDSFTHGSSAQRLTWFKRGLESGALESCDTFSGR